MSLISCPECKREISSFSDKCVHCGFPLAKIDELPKRRPRPRKPAPNRPPSAPETPRAGVRCTATQEAGQSDPLHHYQRLVDAKEADCTFDEGFALARLLPPVPPTATAQLRALASKAFGYALRYYIGSPSPKEMFAFMSAALGAVSAEEVTNAVKDKIYNYEENLPKGKAQLAAVFSLLHALGNKSLPEEPDFCCLTSYSYADEWEYNKEYFLALCEMLPESFDHAARALKRWVSAILARKLSEGDVDMAALDLFQEAHPDVELDYASASRDMEFIDSSLEPFAAAQRAEENLEQKKNDAISEIRDILFASLERNTAVRLVRAARVGILLSPTCQTED